MEIKSPYKRYFLPSHFFLNWLPLVLLSFNSTYLFARSLNRFDANFSKNVISIGSKSKFIKKYNPSSTTITSFSPTTAGTGTTVTILGGGFTGATGVSFGGTAAKSFKIISDSVMTAIVAGGASGAITITTPNGTATLAGFNYLTAPAISYTQPQTYLLNTAIVPLEPTNNGGAIPANAYAQVSTIAGSGGNSGSVNGQGTNARFLHPASLATDAKGNIFVADASNNLIRKITLDGLVSTFAGDGTKGSNNGQGLNASFTYPYGIATDVQGNVLVAENSCLIRKITSSGLVSTVAGNSSSNYPGSPIINGKGLKASFYGPTGLTLDASGNIYVADEGHSVIRKIDPDTNVTTYAGKGYGSTDGSAATASFEYPYDVATDAVGNVYVADENNFAVRKIDNTGNVTTIANDKNGIYQPAGITVDFTNNLYVTNGDGIIRKIDANGNVSILAGGNIRDHYSDGIGNTTGFVTPWGIIIDNIGSSLYVSDYNANTIRKITLTGYSISPTTLPVGLSFDYTTGTISGKPTAVSPATTYTITAYNVAGSSSATVTIEIKNSLSKNAALSNLVPSSGSLNPSFNPTTFSYTNNVNNNISSITLTPTTADANATVKINGNLVGSGTASQSIPLNVGNNTITTIVTAQDGVSTQTYTVTVIRAASNNANLSNLVPSSGSLYPSFNPTTFNYTASVNNNINSITLIPTTADASAIVRINGNLVSSGTLSQSIPLNVGNNTITTIVTAQDGITTQTYIVTVIRNLDTQTITFNPIPSVTFGAADFSPGATVNSTLPITYTSSNSEVATIINNKIHVVAVGQTNITANVQGNGQYAVATPITQTLIVNKASQTIQGSAPPPLIEIGGVIDLSVFSASSGLEVSFEISDPSIASISGKILHVIKTGTFTLTVKQLGNNNYLATETSYTLSVFLSDIVITPVVTPNSDGIDDYLAFQGLELYPNNSVTLLNRNGVIIYKASGYDNSSIRFEGRSNVSNDFQPSGTYIYVVDFTNNGVKKHLSGYFVLKY